MGQFYTGFVGTYEYPPNETHKAIKPSLCSLDRVPSTPAYMRPLPDSYISRRLLWKGAVATRTFGNAFGGFSGGYIGVTTYDGSAGIGGFQTDSDGNRNIYLTIAIRASLSDTTPHSNTGSTEFIRTDDPITGNSTFSGSGYYSNDVGHFENQSIDANGIITVTTEAGTSTSDWNTFANNILTNILENPHTTTETKVEKNFTSPTSSQINTIEISDQLTDFDGVLDGLKSAIEDHVDLGSIPFGIAGFQLYCRHTPIVPLEYGYLVANIASATTALATAVAAESAAHTALQAEYDRTPSAKAALLAAYTTLVSRNCDRERAFRPVRLATNAADFEAAYPAFQAALTAEGAARGALGVILHPLANLANCIFDYQIAQAALDRAHRLLDFLNAAQDLWLSAASASASATLHNGVWVAIPIGPEGGETSNNRGEVQIAFRKRLHYPFADSGSVAGVTIQTARYKLRAGGPPQNGSIVGSASFWNWRPAPQDFIFRWSEVTKDRSSTLHFGPFYKFASAEAKSQNVTMSPLPDGWFVDSDEYDIPAPSSGETTVDVAGPNILGGASINMERIERRNYKMGIPSYRVEGGATARVFKRETVTQPSGEVWSQVYSIEDGYVVVNMDDNVPLYYSGGGGSFPIGDPLENLASTPQSETRWVWPDGTIFELSEEDTTADLQARTRAQLDEVDLLDDVGASEGPVFLNAPGNQFARPVSGNALSRDETFLLMIKSSWQVRLDIGDQIDEVDRNFNVVLEKMTFNVVTGAVTRQEVNVSLLIPAYQGEGNSDATKWEDFPAGVLIYLRVKQSPTDPSFIPVELACDSAP